MLYIIDRKQKRFEQGIFQIIDNYLRENGQEPDNMSEQERSRIYFHFVDKALDEIGKQSEEERDAKGY